MQSTHVLAGVIGGLTALAGVWIAQKNEARKARRDERKKAYLEIIDLVTKAAKTGDADSEALSHCMIQMQLLGSKSILIKMASITQEMLTEKDIAKRMKTFGKFVEEIVPLMRKDILLDKDDLLSDSQKAEAKQYLQKIGKN
jgi:hypothetical protein